MDHLTPHNIFSITILIIVYTFQKRKNDYLEGQFKDWPFMSVHFWGEKPFGTWKLEIENTGSLLNRGQ